MHFHWLRGTCASVRHFMGDTPICVLLDDDVYPADLVETYGVQVLSRRDLTFEGSRAGLLHSLPLKNLAPWIAPFETFLMIDCDAVAWGDMRRLADFERFDFIVDAPGRQWVGGVMDVDAVERHVPGFDARRHVADYVNTGVFFARRAAFDLDSYLELAALSRAHPGMLKYRDQGLFNLMLFRAADEGAIRVGQRELQVVVGQTDRDELVRRFVFDGARPVATGDPVVIHWASGAAKPSVRQRRGDFFAPMTHFRREYRRAAQGGSRRDDLLRLRLEDVLCADRRSTHLRGRVERSRMRARRFWEQTKVRVRRHVPPRPARADNRRAGT